MANDDQDPSFSLVVGERSWLEYATEFNLEPDNHDHLRLVDALFDENAHKRWIRLNVCFDRPTWDMVKFIGAFLETLLENLEVLHILHVHDWMVIASAVIRLSPIRTLSIEEVLVGPCRDTFSKLKSLDFTYGPGNSWSRDKYEWINKLKSVESLTLRNEFLHETFEEPERSIVLPTLRSLTLQGYFNEEFLRYWHLPALLRLTFTSTSIMPLYTSLQASLTEFYWETLSPSMMSIPNLDFATNFGRFLLRYSSISTIKIPSFARMIALEAMECTGNHGSGSVEVLSSTVMDDDSLLMEIRIYSFSSNITE